MWYYKTNNNRVAKNIKITPADLTGWLTCETDLDMYKVFKSYGMETDAKKRGVTVTDEELISLETVFGKLETYEACKSIVVPATDTVPEHTLDTELKMLIDMFPDYFGYASVIDLEHPKVIEALTHTPSYFDLNEIKLAILKVRQR